MATFLNAELEDEIVSSLHRTDPVRGLTHSFYRYPARMSPYLARDVIRHLTKPGDVVLDPFMGGGTTVVEAVASGRRAVGFDVNPLATFVTSVKTTPLSPADRRVVEQWAGEQELGSVGYSELEGEISDTRLKNLPASLVPYFARALKQTVTLPYARQRRFARCALLRLGQWAIDGKRTTAEAPEVSNALPGLINEMLVGLDDLAMAAHAAGVAKNKITGQRAILLRTAVGMEDEPIVQTVRSDVKLVLTSPPYPGVHVLYHRWQVLGRRETPAPYWLIDSVDGHGASFYTLGSRTPFGIHNYFQTLTAAFHSVRAVVNPKALVVQLVAFSDISSQLPAFLRAMEDAGFREVLPASPDRADYWRTIPNRQWYFRTDPDRGIARELLLLHRPS